MGISFMTGCSIMCRTTDGEMQKIIKTDRKSKTPLKLNGFINGGRGICEWCSEEYPG